MKLTTCIKPDKFYQLYRRETRSGFFAIVANVYTIIDNDGDLAVRGVDGLGLTDRCTVIPFTTDGFNTRKVSTIHNNVMYELNEDEINSLIMNNI